MRTKVKVVIFAMMLVSICAISYGQDKTNGSFGYSAGFSTGLNRGFGIMTNFTVHNLAKEFPFELRFGMGYSFLNPGNAADARRIFINNATNGEPEKKGRSFDCRLDFLLPKSVFGMNHSYIIFGPRFSTFNGDFKYVGGNEDFEVTSHQWGIGGGIENHVKMAQNLTLILVVGLDSYFPSTLTGHDTSYSPDNDNVNPENDNQNNDAPFTYKDANKAIKQPIFMPRAMIGMNIQL
jgi:hypothetical protein